jgi:putative copper resistance protein D
MVSLVTSFGTAGFTLLLAGDRDFDLPAAASLLTLWRVLGAVIFLISPLVLLNVTADMASVSWTSAVALVPEVLAETHAGHVFEWSLPVALAFLLSAYAPLPQSFRIPALFLLAAVLLFLQALLSHAVDKGTLAVVVYFLHEIAVGLWVGALLVFWMIARDSGPLDIWVEHTARRVSKVAFWSVIALVITGTFTAYNGLGFDLYRLLFSAYGRTLIIKVVVFAGVLAIGAYNRYWLVPKVSDPAACDALLRNVQVESAILLLAVLGLATLLANTPPAHSIGVHPGHAMMAMFTASPTRRRLGEFDSQEAGAVLRRLSGWTRKETWCHESADLACGGTSDLHPQYCRPVKRTSSIRTMARRAHQRISPAPD